MKRSAFPRLTIWLFFIGVIFLILMTGFRIIFFFHFKPAEYSLPNSLDALLLGFRFDLRIVAGILLAPFLAGSFRLEYNSHKWLKFSGLLQLLFLSGIIFVLIHLLSGFESPFNALIYFIKGFFGILLISLFIWGDLDPFANPALGRLYKIYFLIVSFLIVLLFLVDFQHYDFLHERVNASVWNYMADATISMKMVWETYPVVGLLLILCTLTGLLYGAILFVYRRLADRFYSGQFLHKTLFTGVFALLLIIAVFGSLQIIPPKSKNALQWNDAFAFRDDFKAGLSLNPAQSFLSTLQYGELFYDPEKVRGFYPLMSSYLKVQNPDVDKVSYNRYFSGRETGSKPNVVLIICESFSAFKSSMWGNGLNTTPYFNQLCAEGVFFDRCFTPGYGTAQGVWATITGIPDVEHRGTASQNPAYVNQHSIINDFRGYEKFYFIGGASGWANLRGLFDNNIDGIKIYDERNLRSKPLNLWGISDKNLFLEADSVFQKQSKPFFAVIQTSTNHSPFDFDKNDFSEFQLKSYPRDTLFKYGFQSNEEMNAFRYTDFSFEKFIETAKKHDYFQNTLFVFVGDHAKGGLPPNMFPKAWELCKLSLTHVPLLFYAPYLLSPQRVQTTASQLDVLPSVAALAHISYTNTTLGQNLFDTLSGISRLKNPRFLFNSTLKTMGVITDQYVYTKNFLTSTEEFYSSVNDVPIPATKESEKTREEMKQLTEAYFETAKYMLSNNKKAEVLTSAQNLKK